MGRIVLLTLAWVVAASAQPDTLWTRTYDGGTSEYCLSVIPTTDAGYLLTGVALQRDVDVYDGYVLKTDSAGTMQWSRVLRGDGDDRLIDAVQVADGGYMLVGYTASFSVGGYDGWVIRLGPEGDSLWSRSFGGSSRDKFRAAALADDGNVIIAGNTESVPGFRCLGWAVKITPDGDTLWTRHYGGMFYESFEDCIVTSRGDLRFAGYTGVWDGDVWLVATNTDGDSLWSQRFSEGPHEEAQGMAPANDGGIVVCGSSGPFPGADWFIAKTDTLGIPIWERMFAEGGDGICTEIRPLQQGGYLGIGSSGSTEIPDIPWEIKLIRVTEAGDSLWGLHLTIGHDCGARSGFQTPDGGFIVAGWSAATDTSSDDLLLVRFGRESLNAEPSGNGVARAFALHPIYPNPFNSTATISFVLPSPEHVDLRVFDVTGRHVASVADQMFNAGVHSITYDASGLTSGVYFCRLMAGGFSQTRKMLLVK